MSTRKRGCTKSARIPFLRINLRALKPLKTSLGLVAFIIISIVVISSSAATVNVTSSSSEAKLGMLIQTYYENSDASQKTTPTVNTQASIPASNGSYVIAPGASACIWTNQFATATALPEGTMALDLWAGTTPSLDGKASANCAGESGSVTLTTTQTNDLIYVVVSATSDADVSVSGAGLSWNLRAAQVAYQNAGKVWAFYAVSANVLSSSAITVNLSSNQSFAVSAFGISGVNIAAPFDSNLVSAKKANGVGATPSTSFNTAAKNDFLIAALYVNGTPNVLLGSTYSLIEKESYPNQLTGVTVEQNGASAGVQTVSFTLSSSSSAWALIGDAVVPSSSADALSVSAYTTTSTGENSGVLFSCVDVTALSATSGQVPFVFPVAAASIPSHGYVKIVFTASGHAGINVEWGSGKPTNVQLAFTYG
jgi:hypothetical protein